MLKLRDLIEQLIKKDLIKSFNSRLEIMIDSGLLEPESFAKSETSEIELPVRVVVGPLFCDYLFSDETINECHSRLRLLLGAKFPREDTDTYETKHVEYDSKNIQIVFSREKII